mmetsp:Transcript_12969/g.27956  ORF Transcript_12969/g.27956 Transcript_12969/m.27956 type:complete len:275 (+) Transcript_12969:834-1658(+)
MGEVGNLVQLLVGVMHAGRRRRRGSCSGSLIRTTFVFRIHPTKLTIPLTSTTRSILSRHVHDGMTNHVEFVGAGLRRPFTCAAARQRRVHRTDGARHHDRIARVAQIHQIVRDLNLHVSRRSPGIPTLAVHIPIYAIAILQVFEKLFPYLLNLELLHVAKIGNFAIQLELLTSALGIRASRGRGVLAIHETGDLIRTAFGAGESHVQYAQSLRTSFCDGAAEGDEAADRRCANVCHANVRGGGEVVESRTVDGRVKRAQMGVLVSVLLKWAGRG